jgi:hypothetical protein
MSRFTKTFVFLFSFLACSPAIFSQVKYESGYFITNDDQRTECLILALEWSNNPTEFSFKRDETGKPETKKIGQVKEFSLTGSSRFVRAVVDIDQSSDNLDELTSNRNPVWKKDSVFLRVLVGGKATLYSYTKGNMLRYFYNTEQKEITQLIYKRFLTGNGIAVENNSFQQQLFNDVKCPNATLKDVTKLMYKDNSLIKHFIEYLACYGDTGQVDKGYHAHKRKVVTLVLGVQLIAGVNKSSLLVPTADENTNKRIGVELEYFMGNRNKWSFFMDPNLNFVPNFFFISMPVGFRHYFHLGDQTRLFLNVSLFGPFYSPDAKIFGLGIYPPFVGGGVSYNRFRLEARIPTTSQASTLSTLTLGYNLSSNKKTKE